MAVPALLDRLVRRVAGSSHPEAILLFAAVLALDGADKGAIGAMAVPLQRSLHIGKTDLGLLLTMSLGVGAAATLPFGWLVDRVNRTRLLAWTVAAWGAAMCLSAFAGSYLFLLLTRILLGGVTASAAPAVASLVGDYFESSRRGWVYSQVLTGEILGTGVGFLVAGELSAWTWRAGFVALAIPAWMLSWALRRLEEPHRPAPSADHAKAGRGRIDDLISQQDVNPRPELLVEGDTRDKSIWWALHYVLKVPTNRRLILASSLGYFYFTGLRAFGVEYVRNWFHIGHGVAVVLLLLVGTAALAGVLVSGRLADRLIADGYLPARVLVASVAYLASAAAFFVALLPSSLWIAIPLLALGAAMLGAVNPPLDAARLDIMHPALWGRAESVRTFLRKSGEAIAPVSFAYVAEAFNRGGAVSGLHITFLVMLATVVAGGLVGLKARHTYPRDVASAQANAQGPSPS